MFRIVTASWLCAMSCTWRRKQCLIVAGEHLENLESIQGQKGREPVILSHPEYHCCDLAFSLSDLLVLIIFSFLPSYNIKGNIQYQELGSVQGFFL